MGVVRMSDIPERVLEHPKRKSVVVRMGQLLDVGTRIQRTQVYASNRRIADVLREGAWKGERCFVIAGGPSVNEFDLKSIEGEHTIAVNMAFRLFRPEIIYGTDARLWGWIEGNAMQPGDKELFDTCGAIKVWSDLNNSPLPEDIVIAPTHSGGRLSPSFKSGIAPGTNSGFGALNLAILMGAKEIYLIGFDFYGARWHSGYPEPSEAGGSYHAECFEENSAEFNELMKKEGIRIINLNKKSKLKVFEYGEMPTDLRKARTEPVKSSVARVERVKGDSEPLFVNCYTVENGYGVISKKMQASLERLDIEFNAQPVRDRGNWDDNTKIKPSFILKMLEDNPERDIVWIDADALVVSLPEKLLNCEADFACRIRSTGELISSIMFFKNNTKAKALLKETIALIKKGEVRDFGEQKFFQEAFEIVSKRKGFKFENLPEEYCWIVGISNSQLEPVIEMHQASRGKR